MVHVDCRATSDRTAQASPLARVGRLPALDFRRRAVVVAQTGPCLHQRWARCGHMASEQNMYVCRPMYVHVSMYVCMYACVHMSKIVNFIYWPSIYIAPLQDIYPKAPSALAHTII